MIKFKVSGAKNPLTKGEKVYSAKICHNEVVRGKVLGARQFEFTRMNPVMFKNLMHEVCAFVAQELARGNDVDLGPFKVTTRIRGGFDSPTADFDPAKNDVVVKVLPGIELKKALKEAMGDTLPVRSDFKEGEGQTPQTPRGLSPDPVV